MTSCCDDFIFNDKKQTDFKTSDFCELALLDKVKTLSKCRTLSKRSFVRPALDARELQMAGSTSSATLLEMKKFLRQKSVDFTESHACLIITLPKHAVSQNLETLLGNKLFSRASVDEMLEEALTKVYVNKLTSRFFCPDEAIFGDWSNLRAFLLAWQKQKFAKKSKICDQVPPLGHSLNLDQVLTYFVLFSRTVYIRKPDSPAFERSSLGHFLCPGLEWLD
jgi:hypothetical protein